MALSFAISSTDNVDVGKNSSINNLSAGSIFAWVFPNVVTTSANHRIADKNGGTQRFIFVIRDTADGDLRFGYNRSTSNLNLLAPTGTVVASAWQMLGASWDTSLTNTDQHLYVGTLSAVVAEIGSYSTRQVGSGTHDDSAADLVFGNQTSPTTGNALNGLLAVVGMWNRQLTIGEWIDQQYRPHVTSGCVGFWQLGLDGGIASQYDLSGNQNKGTVTGAVGAAHPGSPFQAWLGMKEFPIKPTRPRAFAPGLAR